MDNIELPKLTTSTCTRPREIATCVRCCTFRVDQAHMVRAACAGAPVPSVRSTLHVACGKIPVELSGVWGRRLHAVSTSSTQLCAVCLGTILSRRGLGGTGPIVILSRNRTGDFHLFLVLSLVYRVRGSNSGRGSVLLGCCSRDR